MPKKDTQTPSDEEVPLPVGVGPGELSDTDREVVEGALAGRGVVEKVLVSDILPSGSYGTSYVAVTDSEVCTIVDSAAQLRLSFANLSEVMTRDFVGNGLLEARTKDGRRVEIARYSRTLSDAAQELAADIGTRLGLSEEDLRDQQESAERSSGPTEAAGAYRCPTCSYPLVHQGDACPRCASKRSFLRRVSKYVKPNMPIVVAGGFLSIVVTLCNLAPGLLVRLLVDEAIMAEDLARAARYRTLFLIIGVYLGFIVIRFVTQHFRIKTMGTLGTRIVRSLRLDTYRALQRLSLSYYDGELTGRIMARVLSDTQMVQGFVVNALQTSLINILMIVGISITLFTASPTLAVIALGPIPVVILIGRYFSARFRGIFRLVRRKYSTLSASVAESVTGVRVVKSFAQEDREYEAFEGKNDALYNAAISAVNTRSRFRPAVIFVMTLGTIVVWLVGGRAVVQGVLSLGLLLQFITYMNQFYAPIQQLIQLTETYQQSATAAERVFGIMTMPSEVSNHDMSVDLKDPAGKIELRDVSFGYQAGDRILKNVNITIEPGEMIGVVGETGAGKSTLVALVCRFYDPDSGVVLLDGQDLRDIRTQSLRSSIGMVLQETFLFARTVKENIAYGTPLVSDRAIIEAAKAANAHEFIMNLPDGYDSEVGERGVTLSGGEKQRISIARAILRNPAILILDEATSAVDSATEVAIQEAMDRLVKGRTTIAIAHRLSTLRNADKLIVVQDGEIAEAGSHQELLDAGGIYADLCNKQAAFAREIVGGSQALFEN